MGFVTAPGVNEQFAVYEVEIPGGGKAFLVGTVVGPINAPRLVDDADGLRMPSLMVARGSSGEEINVADPTTQSLRVFLTGASAVSQSIDGSPFSPFEDVGVAQLYATGDPGEIPEGISVGVPRLSRYRIIPVSGPPRDLQVQTPAPVRLTTSAEVQLLAAGATGVYHDLKHLTITTNFVVQQDPSIEIHLRDTTTGAIRWTAAIPEKSGGTFVFPVHRAQTSPASAWTAQLSVAPPAGRAVILNAEAERRLD